MHCHQKKYSWGLYEVFNPSTLSNSLTQSLLVEKALEIYTMYSFKIAGRQIEGHEGHEAHEDHGGYNVVFTSTFSLKWKSLTVVYFLKASIIQLWPLQREIKVGTFSCFTEYFFISHHG